MIAIFHVWSPLNWSRFSWKIWLCWTYNSSYWWKITTSTSKSHFQIYFEMTTFLVLWNIQIIKSRKFKIEITCSIAQENAFNDEWIYEEYFGGSSKIRNGEFCVVADVLVQFCKQEFGIYLTEKYFFVEHLIFKKSKI